MAEEKIDPINVFEVPGDNLPIIDKLPFYLPALRVNTSSQSNVCTIEVIRHPDMTDEENALLQRQQELINNILGLTVMAMQNDAPRGLAEQVMRDTTFRIISDPVQAIAIISILLGSIFHLINRSDGSPEPVGAMNGEDFLWKRIEDSGGHRYTALDENGQPQSYRIHKEDDNGAH